MPLTIPPFSPNLVQDLAEVIGSDHRDWVHSIELLEDSPLRSVVPGDALTISCHHHQGIGRLGSGLVASAFAADGTIEAMALDGHDGWYLGVQWHPEDTADTDPDQAGLFSALVEAAAQRR